MQYFRFANNKYNHIEPVAVDEIDLTKKTLFIFPGLEVLNPLPEWNGYEKGAKVPLFNNIPCEPYSEITDKVEKQRIGNEIAKHGTKKPFAGHLIHLLERGVVLAEGRGFDASNIVICTYDSSEKNTADLRKMAADTNYVSTEAKGFTRDLYKNLNSKKEGVDASNITLLGWSYGTSFMQQLSTNMQRLNKGIDIPKIHAIGVACTSDIGTIFQKGFPGVYMYGLNDTIIPQFVRESQTNFLEKFTNFSKFARITQLNSAKKELLSDELNIDAHLRKNNIGSIANIIHAFSPPAKDQLLLFNHLPTTVNRYRKLPKGKILDGKDHIAQPNFENESGHAPVGFMEAISGSYFYDKDGIKIEMFEHSNIFRNATSAILGRVKEKPVTSDMLLGVDELNEEERADNLNSRDIKSYLYLNEKARPSLSI